MAYGKNKGLNKGGKKGAKKKVQDPFLKKVWYDVKAPAVFSVRKVGRTLVTKTMGQKIETDGLKGRVAEFNLCDMTYPGDEVQDGFKKMRLCIEEIQGKSCLTDFYGMSLTRDKVCQLIKKRQTLIEAYQDVKTTDGFVVRVFCMAFTAKQKDQVKLSAYAQSAQIKRIRIKMREIMEFEISRGPLKDLVKKIIQRHIENDILSKTRGIFPLKECHIQKVKIVKKPKLDIVRLFEMHDKTDADDTGVPVQAAEETEAKNLLTTAA